MPATAFDTNRADFPNPGEQTLVISTPGHEARFVRVTASVLGRIEANRYALALAEIQVFSKQRNTALGSPVEALDSTEMYLWSRQFLVDGFSSRGELLNRPLLPNK
jgi:hypothetical protein